MALRVVIYQIPGHARSTAVCKAMARGVRAAGDLVSVVPATRAGSPSHDVAIFYGLAGRLKNVLREYGESRKRHAVYIDLGYWGRKAGGRFLGYHKVAVDSRHPTDYFQRVAHPGDRAAALGLKVEPWREKGEHILVAGMGPKGAAAEGFFPGQWEARTIAMLRKHTKRPIIYRPKPNYRIARPIPGAEFDAPADGVPLADRLRNAHAVVVNHSNVAVEALLAGVPVFAAKGAASVMGLSDLSRIEEPIFPDGREQWMADLAYTQFNVKEMGAGVAWRHLKKEGLV